MLPYCCLLLMLFWVVFFFFLDFVPGFMSLDFCPTIVAWWSLDLMPDSSPCSELRLGFVCLVFLTSCLIDTSHLPPASTRQYTALIVIKKINKKKIAHTYFQFKIWTWIQIFGALNWYKNNHFSDRICFRRTRSTRVRCIPSYMSPFPLNLHS